jgi:pilus assembly protein CpaC
MVVWLIVQGKITFARQEAIAQAASKPLIQIGVEVVEVDEQKTHKLGIQWLSQLHVEEASVPSLLSVGTLTRGKVFADLQMMFEHGTADLLANPKLVTRDGTTATFHSGGELPYAVSGSLGTSTVEFKPYGVDLKIAPHLDESGRIALSIHAEVSSPDNQNSVTLSGNVVPGIRSRQVSSQITLEQGATLTLAGLIQTDKESTRKGIPGLMHIPLLGYLFSCKVDTYRRTSIVVFVTPTVLQEGQFHTAPVAPLPVEAGEAGNL